MLIRAGLRAMESFSHRCEILSAAFRPNSADQQSKTLGG